MTALEAATARYAPALESELRAIVQPRSPATAALAGMLHYHLGWCDSSLAPMQTNSGKRVRPLLCLLACQACGGDWRQALPAAAAIELLHNFSLIHDDIEDGDATRRGRATLWTLWGQPQAINAGDALLALAQLALLRLADVLPDPASVVAASRLLNTAYLALTEGQYLDISFERRQNVTVSEYIEMIQGKTAALVACACEMGALIASAGLRSPELRAFGQHLGLAFQIQDDVLGVWGDPALTGKPVGSDLIRRKKSLPILHGLEHSPELRELLSQERLMAEDLARSIALLEAGQSRAYAEDLARQHHAQACAALERADLMAPAAEALRELADSLLSRNQ